MSMIDDFLLAGILILSCFLFYFVDTLRTEIKRLRREVKQLEKNILFLRNDHQRVADSHAALTIEVRGLKKFPLKKLSGVLTMEDRGGKKAKVDATFYVKKE